MSYILKFEYSNKYINNQLLPWKEELNKKELTSHNDMNVILQIGTAIKYSNNTIKIITPFFIHIPYSKCSILNTELTLQLVSYCYFTRVAIYTINIKHIKEYIEFENIDTNLSQLDNISIKQIDKSIIKLSDINIVFENLMNDNIYPFVWLKSTINDDNIILGSPIYANDKFIGIIYNIVDNVINIICNINIIMNLSNNKLSNIYFDIDQSIITKIYSNKYNNLNIGDSIYKIDDICINDDQILYTKLDIDIPINTYIWYESIYSNIFKFTIKRDDRILNLNIKTEQLENKLSVTINNNSEYKIINNIIFTKINLLMIEWLTKNNIIFKNYLYLLYLINPFYKNKDNYIIIGIIDIDKHPINIKKLIEPYSKEIYNIQKFMETFTISSINNKKLYNLNKLESIQKLILNDSSENEIVLNWCY
jgi:hypothetical protein